VTLDAARWVNICEGRVRELKNGKGVVNTDGVWNVFVRRDADGSRLYGYRIVGEVHPHYGVHSDN